jgi:hypothetical protein
MIGEPPVDKPFLQVNPITEAVVTLTSSYRLIGASGTKRIMAPFAAKDSTDSP